MDLLVNPDETYYIGHNGPAKVSARFKHLNNKSNCWSVRALCSANGICSKCYDLYKKIDQEGAMYMFSWIVGLYYCTIYHVCASYVYLS